MHLPRLHVATLYTDQGAYYAMRESFESGGFTAPACRYTALDNRARNVHEPYSAIGRLVQSTPEPYLLLCHQDVRLPGHSTLDALLARLQELDALHPEWAVAGVAGVSADLATSACYTDPCGRYHTHGLPARVACLDECFLLVKTSSRVACSPGLSGFHLYGTDLCLKAEAAGFGCYVVEFEVHHLSAGSPRSQAFRQCSAALSSAWSPKYRFRYVQTMCAGICLSRSRVLRMVFGLPIASRIARRHQRAFARLSRRLAGQDAGYAAAVMPVKSE